MVRAGASLNIIAIFVVSVICIIILNTIFGYNIRTIPNWVQWRTFNVQD